MFGSQYYRFPEVLMGSLREMSKENKNISQGKSKLFVLLTKMYLWIFGIPEIGFQIRSQYFKKIITAVISGKNVERVLDAGSGIGTYSFWLGKKFKNTIIDGWEIDKRKLNFSKRLAEELSIKNVNFLYGNITKSSSKNNSKYDLIVNIDVLEHIDDYRKVLKNFYSLLKPGGYLYVHVPQVNQKRIFKQLENWHHKGHEREGFNLESLKKDFKQIGFKTIEARETFGFFGKLAWELNHMLLPKGFFILGTTYPFIYLIACLDQLFSNRQGLGVAILARK
jgi:2-polyprenyl-3-methyl-5-hydroxy-6-metoxy-1,4-benzoquinol methylase